MAGVHRGDESRGVRSELTPPPGLPVRILRVLLAVAASFLALLVLAILLGAYFPSVPKAGLIGPVLAGQWPFHLLLLALAGLLLAAATWRSGLVRTGRTLVSATAVAVVATLVIAGTQVWYAVRAGTDVSVSEAFTELAYPAVEPDETTTYATPSGEPLQLDAYLPEVAPEVAPGQTVPAIVLAHAGGFHTFDKSDLRGTGRWLAEGGVAAFAVDYRLATADTPSWDQAPQDLVCALGWVGEHAEQYGIDPSRVSLGGMSAGGSLALGVAYRLEAGSVESSCGPTPEPPASVVGFYPGVDVVQMWERDVQGTRRAATWFTGGTPEEFPDRYRDVSPTSHLQEGLMRTLLVVGDRDQSALPELVVGLGDALDAEGVDTEVAVLPFADHAFDDAYGSLPAQASRQILLDFITAAPS